MALKSNSAHDLQIRILRAAAKMDCQNIQKARQGKAVKSVNDAIHELMFIHQFLPFWTPAQRKQKECMLKAKYNI